MNIHSITEIATAVNDPTTSPADFYWIIDKLYTAALRWVLRLENTGRLVPLMRELDDTLNSDKRPYIQAYMLQLYCNYHDIPMGLDQDESALSL